MKTKIKILAGFLLIVLLAALFAVFYWYVQSEKESESSFTCSGNVHFLLRDDYSFSGTVKLAFMNDHRGLLAYSGTLSKEDKDVAKLLRINYFDVKVESNNYFQISNFDIKKNINDTLKDEDFNHLIFDLSSGPRRLEMHHIADNALLIGNVFSPVFICLK